MPALGDWWTSFFHGSFGELQLAGAQSEHTAGEVSALVAALELDSAARVLDVPCGAGRHSLELSRRGYRVTGVDFNPKLIEHARRTAAAEGLAAEFREGDMRELDDRAAFDAAFCHWGSFGYFTDAENAEFLRRVARSLVGGGRFFLDTHVLESLLPRFRERDWQWWGEGDARRRVLEERRFDCLTGRVEADWTFLGSEGEHTERVSIRVYSLRELAALLTRAGFSSFEARDPAGAPFGVGSSRLALVAHTPS